MSNVVLCGFSELDRPYINLIRHCYVGGDYTIAYPDVLGENGYPTSAIPGGNLLLVITDILNNYEGAYTGHWVMKWSGTARFDIGIDNGSISVSDIIQDDNNTVFWTGSGFAVDGTDGRVVVQIPQGVGRLSLNFPADTGTFTNFSDLVFCRADQEALHDAGEIFNPDFIAKLQAINPGVLRFLGWAGTNDGNLISKHEYRAPADYLPTGGWIPNAWVGDISGTDTYTASAYPDMPAEWTHGEMFQGRVLNANTGAATIDVGGRGPKPIASVYGSGITDASSILASTCRTFVYHAPLDCVIQKGPAGWNSGIPGGAWREHPIEVQIALCNKIGCDFWYPMNHLMSDASVTALTELVRDTLDPGLRFFLELSNEVWNFGNGFPQTSLFNTLGGLMGFPSENAEWYHGAFAKRYREVMYLATQAWAPRSSSELRRVMAFQGAGDQNGTRKYRTEGYDLGPGTPGDIGGGTYGCPADSNFGTAPNRPLDYTDVLSYATYYSGVHAKNFDINWTRDENYVTTLDHLNEVTAQADEYASGDSVRMEAALDWLDADLRGPNYETLTAVEGYTTRQNVVAADLGLPIYCYEGSLEIAPPSTSVLTSNGFDAAYYDKIKAFFDAYKRDFRCYKLVRDQYDQFLAYSNAEAPAWFWLSGTQWSMIETNLYGQAYQSYDAVRHYNNGLRRFKVT